MLDVAMPGLDGLGLQQRLTDAGSAVPIVFLTGHGDLPMGVQAMRAGAINFLSKPVHEAVLLGAISEAIERDREARRYRGSVLEARRRLPTLTSREREVLDRIVLGMLNKQIAGELGVVEKTVKVHRGRVMDKMGVRTLAELARIMERMDIDAPPNSR